jgi:eukaryotic-like serine/threonine-protein kinase
MNFGPGWLILGAVETVAGPRQLEPGTKLDDKYRIEQLIAVGGMGAVYLGTHTGLRKRVAIKVLNPQASAAGMIERFHREAITASQIGHEGIAQVTDFGTSRDGEPFLVMEYLEGESLAARLATSGALPIEVACELGCAILAPLGAAHQASVVHRDLKPDNVFLVRQSRGEMVKLLDFGISRAPGLEGEFRLTKTGLVLGTPYYMSPEQARGDSEVGPAADLYAFGVILYEMLTGKVPIEGDNYNQLMYRVLTAEYAKPRSLRPEIPEGLEQIILQAMAIDPADRPGTAAELEHRLLAFCRPTFRSHQIDRISSSGGFSFHALAASASAPISASDLAASRDSTRDASPAASKAGAPALPARDTELTPVTEPAEPAAPRQPSGMPRRALWIAGAGVVVLGAIAGVLVMSPGGGDTAAQTQAQAQSPPQPPPLPPPAASPAPPAEQATVAPAEIMLWFTTDPPNATIELDGKPVTVRELKVPRDDKEHKIRITAPGYGAHEETVRFDENLRVTVLLKRAVTRPPRATPTRPPRAPPTRPPRELIESKSPYDP